ncbi:hypothetical protein PBY51_004996 [Eleginops maclovinus]|uniref:Uncharacterized protein n=1 Tax=Eleginops maclovinus TaxID=56733 RepID=A0AAN7X7K0_ELEMC|nr:hypothetical protein PBY51_004996 [Eleginops maclovinus]
MKYLVLGLFSLTLLGFICTESGKNTETMAVKKPSNSTQSFKNTSNSTQSFQNSTTNNIDSNGNNNNDNTMSTIPSLVGKTTRNGQNLFTSVSLMFASFLLHTL